MPCNPCHHPKTCRTARSGHWKLGNAVEDQISRNGLKLQAWMFLAEPALLRLVRAPGWNKAVSVTEFLLPGFLIWTSRLTVDDFFFFLFYWTKPSQSCLEIILEDYWPEGCCLDIQGTEESPSKAEGTPCELWMWDNICSPWCSTELMLWQSQGWCEGGGSSCVWVLLNHSPDCCSADAFFFISLLFLFCTFIDF